MARDFAPWPSATVLDTTGTVDTSLTAAYEAVRDLRLWPSSAVG
jgi:hypothetical protein